MKNPSLRGKKYFYALGQSARARGMTKEGGMAFYRIEAEGVLPYARIAFDAGYRGLSL